ncbi:hypothetical protein Tco_1061634 [Tanacetum coccineum]
MPCEVWEFVVRGEVRLPNPVNYILNRYQMQQQYHAAGSKDPSTEYWTPGRYLSPYTPIDTTHCRSLKQQENVQNWLPVAVHEES